MKKIGVLFGIFLFMGFYSANASKEPHEIHILKMAEKSIFYTLFVGETECRGGSACQFIPWEGALAFIGAGDSPAALTSLASLERYQFDAALGEDYECYVAEKGRRLIPYLLKMRADRLFEQCVTEFYAADLENSHKKEPAKTRNISYICKDKDSIDRSLKEKIKNLKTSGKCVVGDF